MSDASAFIQNGATKRITAAVTAPTAVQILADFTTGPRPRNQYRVVNAGTEVAFLGAGATAAAAATNSAVVNPISNGIPLLPGATEVFSFPYEWYFTCTTAANTSTVYITPGEGL